jgi:hypothetical protein
MGKLEATSVFVFSLRRGLFPLTTRGEGSE